MQDFEEFDYILCMDKSNLADLKDMQPKGSKAISNAQFNFNFLFIYTYMFELTLRYIDF